MLKNLSGQTLYIENIFAYSKNMQSALSEVLNKKSCIQVITSCGEKDITDLYYETQRENFHLSLYYQIQEYAIGISRENKENNQYLKEINTFLLKEKLSNL